MSTNFENFLQELRIFCLRTTNLRNDNNAMVHFENALHLETQDHCNVLNCVQTLAVPPYSQNRAVYAEKKPNDWTFCLGCHPGNLMKPPLVKLSNELGTMTWDLPVYIVCTSCVHDVVTIMT